MALSRKSRIVIVFIPLRITFRLSSYVVTSHADVVLEFLF